MQITQCDSKGRLYLKDAIRTRYGRRFFVLEVPGELILLPVPEDPIKELEEMGKKLGKYRLEQLKQLIQERAEEEALS